ncbi:hypothetical protein L345_16483, partial [Ophiophagus hannah]
MAAKEKLEAMLNVALRVPSIMLLDVLYRWDVSSFFQQIQRSSLNNNPLFQYKYLDDSALIGNTSLMIGSEDGKSLVQYKKRVKI